MHEQLGSLHYVDMCRLFILLLLTHVQPTLAADTGTSRPSVATSSRGDSGALKEEEEACETSWEFPLTPAVVVSVPAVLPAETTVAAEAPAAVAEASSPQAAELPEEAVTLKAPVTPFSPGSAAAAVAVKRSLSSHLEDGSSSALTRGTNRPHSSSVGNRAAAAGGSTSSSRHKAGHSLNKSHAAAAGASPHSPLADAAAAENTQAVGLEGMGYAGPLGEPLSLPAADADVASTGTGRQRDAFFD